MRSSAFLSPSPTADSQSFLDDILEGFHHFPRTIPAKYLYDEQGSLLFDDICSTEEYYVTRTEYQILHDHIDEISNLCGENIRLVELGSGTGRKTLLLLHNLIKPEAYIPIDISQEMLERSARQLGLLFPNLKLHPLCRDFTGPLTLPEFFPKARRGKTVMFFPGSTIGNFSRHHALELLANFRSMLTPGDGLLIGIDLVKNKEVLEKAYNDREGITAKFNKNILQRINRELDGDFVVKNFLHHAPYNEDKRRIEMHLISLKDQKVHIAGHFFLIKGGEYIHTENSYKYDLPEIAVLASATSFSLRESWTDSNSWFSVNYMEAV